ncbi:MAG: C25 family cysteine peptidase, partial [Fidelibacterota bacterium]
MNRSTIIKLLFIWIAVLTRLSSQEYLVVTHSQLYSDSWYLPLKELKESQGYDVSIINNIQDGWTDTQIHDAIQAHSPFPVYILLIGDAYDTWTEPEDIYQDEEGDLHYPVDASSGNFIPFNYELLKIGPRMSNIANDDYYRCGVDNCYVGRVPADNIQQIENWVNKLIENSDFTEYSAWKNKILFTVDNIDYPPGGCRGIYRDEERDNLITNYVEPYGASYTVLNTMDIGTSQTYPDVDGYPIRAEAFENEVNEGHAVINAFGDVASENFLVNFYYTPPRYEPNWAFSNDREYPFLFGISCSVGRIQRHETPDHTYSVLERLMFLPSAGIIGAIAPTSGTGTWGVRKFEEALFEVFLGAYESIGKGFQSAIAIFLPNVSNQLARSKRMILYGDPSMPLALYQYKDTDITENTTWQGSIVVKNAITLEAGNTLTIKPGTGIFFEPGTSLKVYGNLDAQGTVDYPIVFSRTDPNSQDNRYWDGIWVYSGGSFDLDHIEVYGARFGLHTSYASGSVINSLFEEDYFAAYLYHSDNVTLSGNSFINNRYGSYISYSSSPLVEDNHYSGNVYGIKLSRSSPTIVDNIIENAQYDGLYCSNQSSPAVWTSRPDDGSYPAFNNVFSNNTRSGVYISSNSTPNLGSYFWKPGMDHLGGFNHFDRGSGSYDIKSYSSTTISAEANWWDNMNNYGSVDVLPTAESIFGPLPLERSTGGGADEADSLLSEAYRLEADSAHSDAIALFNAIITINPDDSLVYAAVSGLVRNYRFLDNAAVLLDNLDNIHQQYGQSLAGTVAYDYSV